MGYSLIMIITFKYDLRLNEMITQVEVDPFLCLQSCKTLRRNDSNSIIWNSDIVLDWCNYR